MRSYRENPKSIISKKEPCRNCPIANIEDYNERREDCHNSPASTTGAMSMWRRDWSKGESIDDHNRRRSISHDTGVTLEEAEFIWDCALSQFKGLCEYDPPQDDRDYVKGIGDIPV